MVRQPKIDDAGLDDGIAVAIVDFEDALHARKGDHHAAADRQAPAGQARPRSARHERHAHLAANLHDGDDLFRRSGKHDDVGPVLLDGEPVAFINEQIAGEERTFPTPTMLRNRSARDVAMAVVMRTVYEVHARLFSRSPAAFKA